MGLTKVIISGCRPSSFSSCEDETESNYLLLEISRACSHRPMSIQRCRNYCGNTFVFSKGYSISTLSFLCAFWFILLRILTLFILNMKIIYISYNFCFLLSPFLAFLGDRFIRYWVLLVWTILTVVGTTAGSAVFIIIIIVVLHYLYCTMLRLCPITFEQLCFNQTLFNLVLTNYCLFHYWQKLLSAAFL